MLPVEYDRDVISAPILGLGVQWLMDVSKEVDHEPQGLAAGKLSQRWIRNARRVVGDRTHHAAIKTVSSHVDATLMRRVVLCVDVVPARRIRELGQAPDFVREERCFGDVLAVEKRVDEVVGGRCEVERCKVCNCPMAQRPPGRGQWKKSEDEDEMHGR